MAAVDVEGTDQQSVVPPHLLVGQSLFEKILASVDQ